MKCWHCGSKKFYSYYHSQFLCPLCDKERVIPAYMDEDYKLWRKVEVKDE